MGSIAITFALPTESSDFARWLSSAEDHKVTILHTGVGPKVAANKIGGFLDTTRPSFVISSGFAGALHDGFAVGDLILGCNFSDEGLLTRAVELLSNRSARSARLLSTSRIADSATERNRLRQEHGADAVDMETEAIAAACAERRIGMLSLRIITDTPRKPLPAPPAVLFDLERQRTSLIRLMGYALSHPRTIPQLMRFAQTVNAARAELTSALVALLREQHLLFGK